MSDPRAAARALIDNTDPVMCCAQSRKLLTALSAALEREEEYQALFDLRWKADMRAIKMWREAHPDNDLRQPDHADLCVWLLEELDKYKESLAMSVGDELDRAARKVLEE